MSKRDFCVAIETSGYARDEVIVEEPVRVANGKFQPQVLVVIAPDGVEVVRLFSGAERCKLRLRSMQSIIGRREFVIEGVGFIAPPLALSLHVRFGENGGKVAVSVLGFVESYQ